MSPASGPRGRVLAGGVALLGALAAAAPLAPAALAADREQARLRAALATARAVPEQLVARKALAVPGGGTIRRFGQRAGGLPVHGGEAVVVETPAGEAELVADQTVRRLGTPPPPRLARGAAIRRARAGTGGGPLRLRPRAVLGIDPATRRTAWEVRLATAEPLADLLVYVDARDGRVIRTRDLLRHSTASASLFVPNPVVTRGTSSGLRDLKDRGTSLLASLRVGVTLERLASPRGCLRGEYAHVRLGPTSERVCRRSRSWGNVGRARGSFEALMSYFHVDRTRAYVESLALTRGLRQKPQRVAANVFGADNSYYLPFDRTIGFGTGGVDDAEDGDVIVHEYGHSLQDQQSRFFGTTAEGAAIGEGFGDYLAAAISSLTTGGAERYDVCMFEWDALSYTQRRCARRTDSNTTLPRAIRRCGRGDAHCVGEAWSGALWELRGALGVDSAGRAIGDRVAIQSQFMYARRSGFRDAARALIAADELLYAGVHAPTVEAEMMERGLCPKRGC